MNFMRRLRAWFLCVPITAVVVGVIWGVVNEAASSFEWIVIPIGIFILAGGIFAGEKLYQKYKDQM